MLLELIVENYAVVEQARIRFQAGLNILTGETGSGKSIVVDSLSLLLGARASAEMIRTGASKARVSGIFAVEHTAALINLFAEAGIDHDPADELIVEREIGANGKSRAFVANRPVTTAFLRQLAPLLGDIHGQNEQQHLAAPDRQRDLLDAYSHLSTLRSKVANTFSQWRAVSNRLQELSLNEQEKLRLLDLWSFQRNEIDSLKPRPGEDQELEAERKLLQNVGKLQESANGAFDALYEGPECATKQLRTALKRLDELARYDDSLAGVSSSVKEASALVEDASFTLRDYVGKLEADPERLEDVETRLAALDKLKRKYGGTLEQVLAFFEDVSRKADEVENAAEHKAALERELAAAANAYESASGDLSTQRKASAAKLGKQVEAELKGLAMSGTRFEIDVQRGPWSSAGFDEIRFLVSPNRGEEPKPLEKIASGGELSRIALAMKTAIGSASEDDAQHTLVFDEVDAGVGGAAAAAVGKRLKTLSFANQVICVTHLAQIAGFADHHYAVAKREKSGRVSTVVNELNTADRAMEIGRMLSGEHVTPEALKQAEQLMQAGAALTA